MSHFSKPLSLQELTAEEKIFKENFEAWTKKWNQESEVVQTHKLFGKVFSGTSYERTAQWLHCASNHVYTMGLIALQANKILGAACLALGVVITSKALELQQPMKKKETYTFLERYSSSLGEPLLSPSPERDDSPFEEPPSRPVSRVNSEDDLGMWEGAPSSSFNQVDHDSLTFSRSPSVSS